VTYWRFRRTARLEWIASGAEKMTDTETFRHVIGHFVSGVTVLTARHGGADFGATASRHNDNVKRAIRQAILAGGGRL